MTPTPTGGAAIQPVLWVSPEQFANFMDADEAQFGRYVPARKTSAGNFTMPLFAALAPAQPAAQAVVPTGFLHHVIALCTQRGYSPESIEAWSTDHKWIADLWRQAAQMLAAAPTQPATQQPHRSGCTAGTDEECVQRGCGTNCSAVSPQADNKKKAPL